jgi:3-phenylpropionate/trans-cinnamate dioxygenase ferredoxin reductase subunit
MAGKQDIESTALRPLAFYQSHRIDLLTGTKVIEIDRAGRSVSLASGRRLPYEALVRCPGDFVRDDSAAGIGVGPSEWPS